MAGTSVKRSIETIEFIDLTVDSDDDGSNAPAVTRAIPTTPRTAHITNGGANGQHHSQHTTNPLHAPPPPIRFVAPATATPGYLADDGPPAKRARLYDDQRASEDVYSLIRPYARAGASQAAKEDPRVVESVIKNKLHDALIYQFGNRVALQVQNGGALDDSIRAEILAARKGLLRQLLTLPDCYKPIAPTPAPAPAPIAPPSSVRPLMPKNIPEPNGIGVPSRAQATNSSARPAPIPNLTPIAPARRPVDLPNGLRGGLISNHQTPLAQVSAQVPATRSPALQVPSASGHSDTQHRAQHPPARQTYPTEGTSIAQRPSTQDRVLHDGPALTPRQSRRRNVPATPTSPREARTNVNAPTTPQNFHARAKIAQWKSDSSSRVETNLTSYFALNRRPYVGTKGKQAILRGNGRLSRIQPNLLQKSEVFHVDFALTEVNKLYQAARKRLKKNEKASNDPYRDLAKLLLRLKDPEHNLVQLARYISLELPAREEEDVFAFLDDMWNKRVTPQEQQILSIEKDPFDTRGEDLHHGRLTSLLLARELSGSRYGGTRRLVSSTNEFRKLRESDLQIRSEFTNCAGDVSTVSWISDQAYVAGTTVHMDAHNQQYNKPGNLVLGSVSRGIATLKAYADHRIVRPIVEKGENSSAAMRETQDPWLYTSVVFSDYDPIHERVYTCSFDKTVKAWKVDRSGASMRCIGTWEHRGPVNFVQASLFQNRGAGLVATAADVPTDAVRIYEVSNIDDELATSRFTAFSCSKMHDIAPFDTDKWTYCPSTMKWGIEKSVQQYLLVGYSPRSITGDDGDIPAESLNTGEICLWDASTRTRVPITSAKTQNVFEVLWHPSQPYFIAATSPKGVELKDNKAKTQIRIFRRSSIQGEGICFTEWKTLDCMAADINELTIMPNSVIYCYVTAGCTDGKTYVWDTALGDKPIQILAHGPPLEGIRIDDAEDDTGVKFTAWGSSLDRFYTGSSDGVVKVWNVRSGPRSKAKGKVILEASAQISSGAFSPDRSKLIIGDASGRVFVLSVDEDDGKAPTFIKLPGTNGAIKRRIPIEIEHHAAPPLPPGAKPISGVSAAHEFLSARQLKYTGDPTVGVVRDVNYSSTGFFRKEYHFDYDPTQELLAQHFAKQQDDAKLYSNAWPRIRRLGPLSYTPVDAEEPVNSDDGRQALLSRHGENCKLDLKFENLSLEIRDVLSSGGVGQRELFEGLEYLGIVEDDEAELKKGKVDIAEEAWS